MRQSYFDAHDAFQRYVEEHGAHLGSAALGDADTATTLRSGATAPRVVTDGPFAELAEQIGGYYDVELPDLDAAIAAARLLPPAYTVEIRPVDQDRGVRPAVTPDEAAPRRDGVREEWGRLVALLLAQFRRLDLVEDAPRRRGRGGGAAPGRATASRTSPRPG